MANYYIEKKGVYGQGVLWTGSDLDAGKDKSDFFASNEYDDGYHSYELLELKEPSLDDRRYKDWQCNSTLIYKGRRVSEVNHD